MPSPPKTNGQSYLGVGPVFAIPIKPDADPPLGLDGLPDICRGVAAR